MGSLLSTPDGVRTANECVTEPWLVTSNSTAWVPVTLGLAGVIVNSASLSRTTAGPPRYAASGPGPPRDVAASVRSGLCRVPPAEPQPAISAAAANRAHVRRVMPTQDASVPRFVPDRCGAAQNRPR